MVKIFQKATLDRTDLPPALLHALSSPSLCAPERCPPARSGVDNCASHAPRRAYECHCGARRKPLNPYCAREVTKALVATIAMGDLPADVVETEAFRELIEVICPTYIIPTHREILSALEQPRACGGGDCGDVAMATCTLADKASRQKVLKQARIIPRGELMLSESASCFVH